MKRVFAENGVPTSKFVVMEQLDEEKIKDLSYPIIVKPVDAYSSRGVCKVHSFEELKVAFDNATRISRTNNAIVEEFVEGNEITVDVYVEEGKAHILCLSNLDKIGEGGKFIINRSHIPAAVTPEIEQQIADTAQNIADAFGLKNTPMLIQLISDGKKVSVVEFCARTGGGIKFLMIKKFSGFDVVKAVVTLKNDGLASGDVLQVYFKSESKDAVTLLTTLEDTDITFPEETNEGKSFKEILASLKQKKTTDITETLEKTDSLEEE